MYNTPIDSRIVSLSRDDINWQFRGEPSIALKPRTPDSHGTGLTIDPTLAYAHDRKLVTEMAEAVEKIFPVAIPPQYFVLPCEEPGRTNGHASNFHVYTEERQPDGNHWLYEPYIVLAAKRIPIHPAMTRYLVAHEYGHVVQYHIETARKINRNVSVTDFDREYAKLRGCEVGGHYGPGTWHKSVGELIANDFRICCCGVEEEFWPHPGFKHPLELPEVQEFWAEQRRLYSAVNTPTVHKDTDNGTEHDPRD